MEIKIKKKKTTSEYQNVAILDKIGMCCKIKWDSTFGKKMNFFGQVSTATMTVNDIFYKASSMCRWRRSNDEQRFFFLFFFFP